MEMGLSNLSINALDYRCQSTIARNLSVDFFVIYPHGDAVAAHWYRCVIVVVVVGVVGVVVVKIGVAAAALNFHARFLHAGHHFHKYYFLR